jgi:hypothetical protein
VPLEGAREVTLVGEACFESHSDEGRIAGHEPVSRPLEPKPSNEDADRHVVPGAEGAGQVTWMDPDLARHFRDRHRVGEAIPE